MAHGGVSKKHEGHYDIRAGAAGYAPIVGTFGALAVPAIIVLFTARPTDHSHDTQVALAAGLLVNSMIGSFLGAISMAAIGAETEYAANLPPAVMYIGAAVVISLVNILAAFGVLADIYLKQASFILTMITAAGGILGIYFVSLAIADGWFAGPQKKKARKKWLKGQWIKDQAAAYKAARTVATIGVLPVVAGVVAKLSRVGESPTGLSSNIIIGAGFLLMVAGVWAGTERASHPKNSYSDAARRSEAYGITLSVAVYTLGVLIYLP